MSTPGATPNPGERQHQLDGLSILRFAHAYNTGGGVELHLRDLNNGLATRNAFTAVLVHLSKNADSSGEQIESIGASKLIKVPLPVTAGASSGAAAAGHDDEKPLRHWLLKAVDFSLSSPALNRLFVRTVLRWRRVPTRSGEAIGAGPTTAELIRKYRVQLVVLHTSGGSDALEVIRAARSANIPLALIHHFSNDRLGNISVRQQAAEVDSIAGASAVGLPAYARSKFTNLSDAVDLAFFRKQNAQPVPLSFPTPILFAPGRLTPDKGQADALKVAINLHRRGIKTTLVFAGRVDDAGFEQSLRQQVKEAGLAESVHFAGELTLAQYRDWFNAAYLTLMPTHHHEGMPRTLIDSQAMQVPPLVYDIGGTPDGVRHNQTGFLVKLGDIPAMTEHAATLLLNPAQRHRMADDGRAFVEAEFSMDAFLGRHEQFYLETISQHGQKNR